MSLRRIKQLQFLIGCVLVRHNFKAQRAKPSASLPSQKRRRRRRGKARTSPFRTGIRPFNRMTHAIRHHAVPSTTGNQAFLSLVKRTNNKERDDDDDENNSRRRELKISTIAVHPAVFSALSHFGLFLCPLRCRFMRGWPLFHSNANLLADDKARCLTIHYSLDNVLRNVVAAELTDHLLVLMATRRGALAHSRKGNASQH